jgi:cytochrome c oxidase assembly protein subunit 15
MNMQSVSRKFPAGTHFLAVLAVLFSMLMLVIGGMVTTFHAGMADPVWPTEPWYLYQNFKHDFGYLIEHSHRIIGFSLGAIVTALTYLIWSTEPERRLRKIGYIGMTLFFLAYGVFHGEMSRRGKLESFSWPWALIAVVGVTFLATQLLGLISWKKGFGGGTRWLALTAWAAVMVQGLLGGIRVFSNALAGKELASTHGIFAAIVFSLFVAVMVLTAAPKQYADPTSLAIRKLKWQTFALVLFTFIQIVWGALLRHMPSPLDTRMHLIFAFVVVGFATLTIKQIRSDPATSKLLRGPANLLMALITLQILLGVEAWIGKFMTGIPPELERLTTSRKDMSKAIIRTVHSNIGLWILATSVVFALVTRRRKPELIGPEGSSSLDFPSTSRSEPASAGR